MIDPQKLAAIRASVGKPPENKRVAAYVIARVKSERFPGKVYLDLCGHPMWWHIMQRLEAGARLANCPLVGMAICTTADPSNDILEEQAHRYGYDCFRYKGPEYDVAGRHAAILRHYNAGIAYLASGDCPLCWYEQTPKEYEVIMATNHGAEATWKHGDPKRNVTPVVGKTDMRPRWLYELWQMMANTDDELESQGLIAARDWERRQFRYVPVPRGAYRDVEAEMVDLWRWYKLDVDTYQDGAQMGELYNRFWDGKNPVDARKCIAWIDEHDEYHRNKNKAESAVNQQVHGTDFMQSELRFLDYAEFYLCPEGAPKLYCHECGAYMGYVTTTHGMQHFHRPDGTTITGDANITCPNRHFRAWHHTMQRTITAGSMVAVPEDALRWEPTYSE